MKVLRAVCLICLLLPAISGCKKGQADQEPANQPAGVVPVVVSTIRQGDINTTIVAVGQTEALHKEMVLSPAAGTITSFKALEGTAVKPGEPVVQILTKESQAALTGAKELLAAAATPEQKEDAERALQLAQSSRNFVSVGSRTAGVVSSRSVVEGSLVADGSELLTIVDPASVDFVAQIPLRDLATLKPGETATVSLTSVGHMSFSAIVSAISPESDPQTQTVRVRLNFVSVPSDQRIFLKDGIPGTARIVTGVRANVLLVPTPALLRNDDNNTYAIVTVTSDSLSRSVPVAVGIIEDSSAEISGTALHAGMSVIVAGNYALPDSTRVTVTTRKVQ